MGGVHLHLADDEIGHRLDAPSDDDHELLGEVLGLAEHPLNRIRRADLRSVLPQRVAVVVDSLVDLAIRHGLGGWSHDLDHGVILSLVQLRSATPHHAGFGVPVVTAFNPLSA